MQPRPGPLGPSYRQTARKGTVLATKYKAEGAQQKGSCLAHLEQGRDRESDRLEEGTDDPELSVKARIEEVWVVPRSSDARQQEEDDTERTACLHEPGQGGCKRHAETC